MSFASDLSNMALIIAFAAVGLAQIMAMIRLIIGQSHLINRMLIALLCDGKLLDGGGVVGKFGIGGNLFGMSVLQGALLSSPFPWPFQAFLLVG